jgi:hypothetical protein
MKIDRKNACILYVYVKIDKTFLKYFSLPTKHTMFLQADAIQEAKYVKHVN